MLKSRVDLRLYYLAVQIRQERKAEEEASDGRWRYKLIRDLRSVQLQSSSTLSRVNPNQQQENAETAANQIKFPRSLKNLWR